MVQLILKNDIGQNKIDALLHFLKSWDIDAELKMTKPPKTQKKNDFSLATGIWKDNVIDANALRKKAWNRNK
jgi:hypothetical protein